MSAWVGVYNRSRRSAFLVRARWCRSFFCRLRGLMFRRELASGEGLLLVEARPSRMGTAIHMLFVFMPLGVVWVDADFRVVDRVLARPWRPLYVPAAAAQYILETRPDVLESVDIGEVLEFKHEDED